MGRRGVPRPRSGAVLWELWKEASGLVVPASRLMLAASMLTRHDGAEEMAFQKKIARGALGQLRTRNERVRKRPNGCELMASFPARSALMIGHPAADEGITRMDDAPFCPSTYPLIFQI